MTQTLLTYTLTRTTRRLTFDILHQHPDTIYRGDDDGQYFKFVASNGYEVISRSRMDIQTERLWLLGAKHTEESRSGTMVFSSDAKRDVAYWSFVQSIDEWARANGGRAELVDVQGLVQQKQNATHWLVQTDSGHSELAFTQEQAYQRLGELVAEEPTTLYVSVQTQRSTS